MKVLNTAGFQRSSEVRLEIYKFGRQQVRRSVKRVGRGLDIETLGDRVKRSQVESVVFIFRNAVCQHAISTLQVMQGVDELPLKSFRGCKNDARNEQWDPAITLHADLVL